MPGIQEGTKRRLFANSLLFSDLSEGELDAIVPVARTRSLAKRDELFHKGDDAAEVYVVAHGKLKALTSSPEGDDVVFNILGPGEVIGEIALLAGTTRTATVTAVEASELLSISRRDFESFLRRNPDVALRLLRVLALRVKQVSELVEDTQFLNLPVRFAKKLSALARVYGEKAADGTRINLRFSQEEWGDLVGATRESINKQLRIWTSEKLVTVESGRIVLLDPAALERLASGSTGL